MLKDYKIQAVITSLTLITIFCFDPFSGSAQMDKWYLFQRPFSVRFTYQFLHSTHSTNFNGGSLDFNVSTSKNFMLGVGVQYAGARLHNDNGWVLTRLRFLPVYLNTTYLLCSSCTVQPYIHTEEGISFNHYNKLDPAVSDKPYKVAEEGFYLSVNGGTNFIISKGVKAFTEIGYKGYKHSFDALDVNPHGFTARVGVELY